MYLNIQKIKKAINHNITEIKLVLDQETEGSVWQVHYNGLLINLGVILVYHVW